MPWTADLETTTDENDCRVWVYGLCNINNPDDFHYGTTLTEFFDWCRKSKNETVYFHNLKFDGEFLLYWLFENGFKFVADKSEVADKTFTTLISDSNQFYSIEVYFKVFGKKRVKVTIYDSYKIIPLKVKKIAKSFGLEMSKLDIDYTLPRPVGYIPTPDEIQYLKHDVAIVAKALKVLFDQNLTKMTQGSNAVHDFKNIIGKKYFDYWFPPPDYDHDIRKAYKGGWTYVKPEYAGKDITCGMVFDVNSLYPSVMYNKPLPYGEGIYFRGEYQPDELYNVYVQRLECQFELKEGYLPTIQLKNNLSFLPTEYVTTSNDEFVELYLTSVDLELFFEHYNVYNVQYHDGWKFMSAIGIFKVYIDKWIKVKIDAEKDGNEGMRTLAKLMLNSLYGKFATNPRVQSKMPYYSEGLVKYRLGDEEMRKPMYIPMGAFITAWARYTTITSAQKLYPYFIYADTDSLHLQVDLPEELKSLDKKGFKKLTSDDFAKYDLDLLSELDIDPLKLGAWKAECWYTRARYLRAKSYIHDLQGELHVVCAGLTESCHQFVTWENFQLDQEFSGKLEQVRVKGGIVLKEKPYKLRK